MTRCLQRQALRDNRRKIIDGMAARLLISVISVYTMHLEKSPDIAMSSIKALKKKISKRAKQKKNIQVKNSIRLKQAKEADLAAATTAPADRKSVV